MKHKEAKEYLRGKGLLEQKLIDLAYGRRWGSKPVLIPLSEALKIVQETKKEFLAVDEEKAIDEEYWEIFMKWFLNDNETEAVNLEE